MRLYDRYSATAAERAGQLKPDISTQTEPSRSSTPKFRIDVEKLEGAVGCIFMYEVAFYEELDDMTLR